MMKSTEYKAGCARALAHLGITKHANIPSDQTTYGRITGAIKGIGAPNSPIGQAVRRVIPKTPLGKTVALGGLIGTGLGAYHAGQNKEMGTPMEPPIIAPESIL